MCQHWMTEMLELSNKDFKLTIIKMLQQAVMTTLETNEKEIENLSKEKGNIKNKIGM